MLELDTFVSLAPLPRTRLVISESIVQSSTGIFNFTNLDKSDYITESIPGFDTYIEPISATVARMKQGEGGWQAVMVYRERDAILCLAEVVA